MRAAQLQKVGAHGVTRPTSLQFWLNRSKTLLQRQIAVREVAKTVEPILSLRRLLGGWQLALMALGVCWFLFFNAVHGEWQTNPQYGYGYVVPLLGLALLWRAWPHRPAAAPGEGLALGLVAGTLLLLLLPWRLAIEANPEWRLLYWFGGFQIAGLSLCYFYFAGGWPWVRHFAPALLFMLIAAPWPMNLEQAIVQNLMRFVAALTVEVAGVLGIPAIQHGNLIEVGAGVVGIDEACSGVRSLQSALMLSLFLGELHRFSWRRRAGLLGASLVFVLIANLCRTTFLVWAAASRGLHQMEAWHDTAGNLVMWLVLPGLMLLGHWMKPKEEPDAPTAAPNASVLPAMPRWIGVAIFSWIVFCEFSTEAWYRAHESTQVPNQRWSMAWPSNSPRFKATTIPEKSRAILRCSTSDAAAWEDDDGNKWSAFLLRWEPGRNSAQLAKGHRPDICFPAAGAKLLDDFGQTVVPVNGLDLPFRHQTFESGGGLLHVFYCLWSDRQDPHEQELLENGSEASRLAAIRAGKRNLGQQVLEVVIRGPESNAEAVNLLTQQLQTLIKLD